MKIGIAITKCAREQVFNVTYEHIKKNSVEDAFIYVHDDTETRKGIARSKNACIEALMNEGCDILFLFDDDCYPVSKGWEKRFIDSGLNHACATFTHLANRQPNGNTLLGVDERTGIEHFSNPCGIVLCYKRICIDTVGGMDIGYGKWGNEHVGHSYRIFNAGLTPYPFCQPRRFMSFFYSYDQQQKTRSVLTNDQKTEEIKKGKGILFEEKRNNIWKPYKKMDYCLGAFFTKNIDAQRNTTLPPNIDIAKKWLNSLEEIGLTSVLFNDCFKIKSTLYNKYVPHFCPTTIDVYNYRHLLYLNWIKKNYDYIENEFMTDVTDVVFYQYPPIEKGKIYVGSENETCNLKWLKGIYNKFSKKQQYPIEKLSGKKLLNCGIIYGHKDDIIELLEHMVAILDKEPFMDMYAINWVGHMIMKDKVVTGFPIHTVFRKEEGENSKCYIKHK